MSDALHSRSPPHSNGSAAPNASAAGSTQKPGPSSSSSSSSPSLLSSLRNFRYQPKQVSKISSVNSSNSASIASSTSNSNSATAAAPDNTEKNSTLKFASTQTQTSSSIKSLNQQEIKKRLNDSTSNLDSEASPIKKERISLYASPVKVKKIIIPPDVEILEKSIEFVSGLFPSKDRMEIQDTLVSCNWMVDEAADKLRKAMRGNEVINADTTEDDSPPKKVWRRIQSAPQKRNPVPQQQQQQKPASSIPAPRTAVTDKVIIIDEENDDSSDEEQFDSRSRRFKVFEFLNKSSMNELTTVSSCTIKKAEIIVKLRPFKNWKDLSDKLEDSNINTTSLFANVMDIVRLQNGVSALMRTCSELSQSMAIKLRQLSAADSSNLSEQPSSLSPGLKLAGYQMIGLNWLRLLHEQEVNGILADEMGLGKTVQVIAFLAYLKENNLKTGVHLIVVPSSTLENWSNELTRWCPALNVETYYGSQEERKNLRFWWRDERNKAAVQQVDVLLTTYNLVSSTVDDKCFFRKMMIQYIVYDEAHMLKNMATQRYACLMKIQAEHRVLLTGTPLQNNLVELMSLLIFVMPHMFSEKQEDLKRLFKANPKTSNDEDKNTFETEKIMQAKKIMEPFVLRRLKKDVLQDLPAKTEQIVYCQLSKAQTERYNELIEEFQNDDNNSEDERDTPEVEEGPIEPDEVGAGLTGSMCMMMLLRRAANHPALLKNHYANKLKAIVKRLKMDTLYREENSSNILANLQDMSDHQIHQLCSKYKSISDFKLDSKFLLDSGKFEKFDELLPKLKSEGHRVLIFSQFRQAMDVMGDYCDIRGYSYVRLDGQTPVVERQSLVDEYNKNDSIFLFLLSTKAGGFGINLASADTVIIHDIDLNPYNDKQAEDRCHRVGQTRPVNVMRFISKNTIEEAMLKIAQGKLSLEQQITRGGNSGKQGEKKLMTLLKEALKHQTD